MALRLDTVHCKSVKGAAAETKLCSVKQYNPTISTSSNNECLSKTGTAILRTTKT